MSDYAAEEGQSEPEDTATRQRLGLRPTYYFNHSGKHPHPDPHPCPPWCWIVSDNPDGYTHEVEQDQPMRATHSMTATPEIVASLYPGHQDPGQPVGTATLEFSAFQRWNEDPIIRMYVRQYDRETRQMQFDERLKLTPTDVLELIVALRDVIDRLGGCSESDT